MSDFSPAWLRLREPADADARAAGLVDRLKIHLNRPPLVVRDLGCGTGSLGRWLTGRLPGPQHWVLHDRDPRLLDLARATVTGPGVTVETREGDLAELTAADLAGASLVTASALLDLVTAEQVRGLAAACAGRPVLFTLSVTGRVEFAAAEPLDAVFQEAFNGHQRRGGLLGPDAVGVARAAFAELGAVVATGPSPWRLGTDRRELALEWLRGWVGAAVEQEPELAREAPAYLRRKAADPRVVVHHEDLLAVPG
ncbi:class I SAM-dependent methyltransferase [Saccharothrix xinjiangensis]|uniref:Class I SAM-dependent methyltransferase n=1 Tax=Saccharothrix xinjiangensis TaxID=204798 RepID=A0ABV9XXV6_9PSEU